MMARRGGCGIDRWGVWAWVYDQPPRVCMCVCVFPASNHNHVLHHLVMLLHTCASYSTFFGSNANTRCLWSTHEHGHGQPLVSAIGAALADGKL